MKVGGISEGGWSICRRVVYLKDGGISECGWST